MGEIARHHDHPAKILSFSRDSLSALPAAQSRPCQSLVLLDPLPSFAICVLRWSLIAVASASDSDTRQLSQPRAEFVGRQYRNDGFRHG